MRLPRVLSLQEPSILPALLLLWTGLAGGWGLLHASATSSDARPASAGTAETNSLPLKASGNGRFLVDQQNRPFLVVGDTGWSLIVQPDEAGIRRYLDDRQQRGFNATIVNLLEHKFCFDPPQTRAGLRPFKSPGDFSTPNEAYFDFAHRVVQEANARGVVVWLAPAYLGFGGGDEGFFREIKTGGKEKLEAYGRFVGKRFRDLPNIVWLLGGDYTPPAPDLWTINDLGRAIAEEDKTHLLTVHAAPETAVPVVFGQEKWLAVSTVYSYKPELFRPLLAEHAVQPARPFVLIETTYEGEHDSKPDQIRRQAYWAMLGGACGQFLGNNPIWHFDGPGLFPSKFTWEQALDATGSRDMARLRALFLQVPWEKLEPEKDHAIVTAGYGEGVRTALTARTTDRQWAVTYLPSTGTGPRDVTVDTGQSHGPRVDARWYNPTSGEFTPVQGSPFATPAVQHFRTPGDNGAQADDWVLVLQADLKQ